MKSREQWLEEAELFVENWNSTSDEVLAFEDVFQEVREGWSAEVDYDGTPEEYARELWDAIQSVGE